MVRFRRVPGQRPCEIPEGFGGEDSVRFRRVPVQMPCEVPKVSGVDAL